MSKIVPGAAFWLSAGAVAAAAVAGFLHWEASRLDAAIQALDGRTVEGGVVRVAERGRTWLSRELDVSYEVGGDALHWRGTAAVGWGARARLKLDTAQGIGRFIPAMGIENWNDEWVIETAPTGSLRRLEWTLKPLAVGDCAVDGMRIRTDLQHWSWEADGFRCRAPEGQAADGDQPAVAAKLEAFRATGEQGVRMQVKTGPFLLNGISARGFQMDYAVETKSKRPGEGAGVLDDAVRTEIIAMEVMNPEAGGEAWDRFAVKSRLSGVSSELLERLRIVSGAAFLGGLTDAQLNAALAALESAFVSDGLVWDLEEAILVQKGQAARLAGRLAYAGPASPGDAPTLGAFTISVPDAMLDEEEKVQASDGSLRREGDFWVSNIEITTEHLLANGIVIF